MFAKVKSTISVPLHDYIEDDEGATSVIFAVSVPAILMSIIFMTEVGYWRNQKADLQSTADMAALAAAYEYMEEEHQPDSKRAAFADAMDNGFLPDIGVLTTNIPPISGAFIGEEAVQVTIEQDLPTFLSGIFLSEPLRAEVTAVAKLGGASVKACVLSLAGSGAGISIGGSVSVSSDGCSLHSNSTSSPAFNVFGAAEITAACASSSGTTQIGGSKPKVFSDCPTPLSNQNQVVDPYADVDVPDDIETAPCQSPTTSGNGNNQTLSFPNAAGRVVKICDNKIDIRNNVDLEPGTYVIDGSELKFGNNGFISGDDVTLIFMNDAEISNVNGGNGFDLAAPNTGPYAGIAMYADRHTMDNEAWKFNGNADMSIYGAIYLPTLDIEYVGGAGTNATASFVVLVE